MRFRGKSLVVITLSALVLVSGCNSSNEEITDDFTSEPTIDINVNSEISENEYLEENNYIGSPNDPNLMTGMTGFYWDNDGNEVIVTSKNKENWYDYKLQINEHDTSKWANAKTEDGSYWVWIPRYEYKIIGEKIEIQFISTTQTVASDGYIIHPAFENGSETGKNNNFQNGEWDKDISGFWVAKYEMSENKEIPQSIPGVTSWRNISFEDSYHKSKDISTDVTGLDNALTDSHLMKNSEWGAVAYLAHSAYGRNGELVSINNDSSFITGGSKGATAFTNKEESTTGNETGVFDMSGGVWERLASYMTNGHDNLTKNASTIASVQLDRNEDGYLLKSTKYLTVYPFDVDDSNIQKNYDVYESLASDSYGYGDAILETSTKGSGSTSWNGDMSNYLFYDDLLFIRGGNNYNGNSAGIFAFNSAGGGANSQLGFRSILIGE